MVTWTPQEVLSIVLNKLGQVMAESLLAKIDKARIPQHIAIIMDGNGR